MSRRALPAAIAVLSGLGLVLVVTPVAHAQVPMMSTGTPGSVSLLDFAGDDASAPVDQTDTSQAALGCYPTTRGHRAVFAGARVWAADLHTGLGNDWQYVRVVAGAFDEEGAALTGEMSAYYPAYDDQPATMPAVGVSLPGTSEGYTPVLMVQFYDANYRLLGTSMIGAQVGAWLVSLAGAALGSYWYVAQVDLARCG
jgi:hypothetical protein